MASQLLSYIPREVHYNVMPHVSASRTRGTLGPAANAQARDLIATLTMYAKRSHDVRSGNRAGRHRTLRRRARAQRGRYEETVEWSTLTLKGMHAAARRAGGAPRTC